MTNANSLAERWDTLGLPASAQVIYADLCTRYEEPHRKYHNLEHIGDCLRELDGARSLCQNAGEIELALWFHDVIYDTHAKDNEKQSANYLIASAKPMGLSYEMVSHAAELILATQHTEAPQTLDTHWIVDIDLAILGQSHTRFDRYEIAIREEYDWVETPAFNTARLAILQTFLQREHIYSTSFFRDKYEGPARKNLTRSITRLQELVITPTRLK